jgi:A/G-specific adenine glycosylase
VIGRSSDFAKRLLRWYDRSRRDLPWRLGPGRPGPLDPYHVLLSETMLQQTQVATVVPYFHRFLERFPTFKDLAAAPEQDVLRLWQGLGYYSRARNLHATARKIVSDFGGLLPSDVQDLLTLPGIGRYTAGAVASIAFGRPAPILDGNVTRVLCRLDAIRSDPRDKSTLDKLWSRAEELLPARRPGDFNSAMMELGATVCTPRNPQCLICPVRAHCQAAASGLQDKIPAPKKSSPTPHLRRKTYCIRHDGRWLFEQRPSTGRWASMWQFITLDPESTTKPPVPVKRPVRIGTVSHTLTHRRYEFDVFAAEAPRDALPTSDVNRIWLSITQLDVYPLPRPHLKMIDLLKSHGLI